jgi:hypothetical protein
MIVLFKPVFTGLLCFLKSLLHGFLAVNFITRWICKILVISILIILFVCMLARTILFLVVVA